MKTTLDLPDDVMRAVKLRAVEEDKKLKDMIAELLRRGLAQDSSDLPVRNRVKLPLITRGHPASPENQLTPERVAEILLQQDEEDYFDAVR